MTSTHTIAIDNSDFEVQATVECADGLPISVLIHEWHTLPDGEWQTSTGTRLIEGYLVQALMSQLRSDPPECARLEREAKAAAPDEIAP